MTTTCPKCDAAITLATATYGDGTRYPYPVANCVCGLYVRRINYDGRGTVDEAFGIVPGSNGAHYVFASRPVEQERADATEIGGVQ